MNYEFNYTKTLEEAGFTDKEAEATIRTVLDMMESKMASKSDLERVELKLYSELKEIRSEMKLLESNLVIKLGKMIVGTLTLLSSIIGVLLATYK